jgi:hypothetical protein
MMPQQRVGLRAAGAAGAAAPARAALLRRRLVPAAARPDARVAPNALLGAGPPPARTAPPGRAAAAAAARGVAPLDDSARARLALGTALRNIGWISFWAQLALTSVAAVILLFSVGVTSGGTLAVSGLDFCTLAAVACGAVATGLSWTWIRAGRRLSALQDVRVQACLGTVLASVNVNLVGLGAAVLGLQATTGALVAKT